MGARIPSLVVFSPRCSLSLELVGPDLGTVLEPGRNTWNLVVPLVHLWDAKSGLLFVSYVVTCLKIMLKAKLIRKYSK